MTGKWSLWGKTGEGDSWLPLMQHLHDSADVAERLWDHWLAASIKQRLAEWCGSPDAARALAIFLAASHDCGKTTPAFQAKGPGHLQEQTLAAGFDFHPLIVRRASQLPHGIAGHQALRVWLADRHEWERSEANTLACVIGGHHGVFPESSHPALARPVSITDLMGDGPWAEARLEIFDEMSLRAGIDPHLDIGREHPIPGPAQSLLTAIVIVADWIASDESLFPYQQATEQRAADAWRALDLPEPWLASLPRDANEALQARFDLPEDAAARPVQQATLEVVDDLDEPGLVIVEAAMGTGKTEAALLAAERLAERFGLNGVYFALPSMATSDAIFSRLHSWVERLDVPEGYRAPLFLAHSRAALNDEYRGIAPNGTFRDLDHDEECGTSTATVHEWLSGRKKGLLATFAVGTIDQVLMMALQSRHLVLRHLGLTSKVVVIDEVHATDVYMSEFLERAIEWLGAYRVPVILLSATLPPRKRATLLQAYLRGRHGQDTPEVDTALLRRRDYPLITATTGNNVTARTAETGVSSPLTVHGLAEDDASLDALLDERLSEGGCAVIIRNTVGRAQETFTRLRERYGDEVTLIHSRFIATARRDKEGELLRRFGAPGPQAERPRRHIVVATQVVEQSLDVDFDLMVTDLAPVDLVLQRAGRLHRHDRERPDALKSPALWVTGVSWGADGLPILERGAAAIYGQDALLRALVTLGLPGTATFSLPGDIPRLVHHAYGDDIVFPRAWDEIVERASNDARKCDDHRQRNARQFRIADPSQPTLMGWTRQAQMLRDDPANETRGKAAVRDGQDSIEVIVVRRLSDELVARWNAGPDDPPIPTQSAPGPDIARAVSADTVQLPPMLTFPGRDLDTIEALEKTFYPGWQASGWLNGQLILEIDEKGQCLLGDFVAHYDDEIGLTVRARKDRE
ncbi:hypothetical protein BHE97_13330 [Aeromicrobium sp. PE09-221]|uniref:CRISPR-associated helicase Cas3' n=1 Tax=Aeromicrobium sp. PE09-221 TaxID=1898043 RepID=UPI000B6A2E29|nr:CRISPR-associated helicase Cas3' [Aeromicrobium sp. PE09-221]OUZ08646.1 hypothetical protein BHE97_13330 [Aeromicrobium sp. PE09-221]